MALEPTTGPGATEVGERALGPDLTRGVMLLSIALANSHYFLRGPSVLGGFPQDGSGLDRAVTWVIASCVDGRAYPLFGLLFGYGVARVVARHPGPPRATRRLLRRRGAVLVAIGAVDALLLYVGDIVAMYGVLLLLGAWAVRLPDRWLLLLAAGFFVLTALPGEHAVTSTDPPDAVLLPPDPLTQVAARIPVALVVALLGPVGFACPFLVGLWAGRRRVLEEVARHRRLLTAVAVVGLASGFLGAQPASLLVAGVTPRPDEGVLDAYGAVHAATGVLAGLGGAAALALLGDRLAPHPGRATRALAATGQRSLTCYLLQSPVWAVVFTPYLLDLSGTLTITGTALLATATWLATVVVADRMARTGRRGPFEVLVRRVTYARPRR